MEKSVVELNSNLSVKYLKTIRVHVLISNFFLLPSKLLAIPPLPR